MLGALLARVVVTGPGLPRGLRHRHAGGLVDRGGLADPTWEFFRAARDEAPSMPPSNLALVEQSIRELYEWSDGGSCRCCCSRSSGCGAGGDAAARRVVSFTLVSLVGLLALASVFMFGWQGYVPRRTGASRIVLEAQPAGPPSHRDRARVPGPRARTWRRGRLLPTPRAGLAWRCWRRSRCAG